MSTTTPPNTYNDGWNDGVSAANEFIGKHTLRQVKNEVARKRDAWNPARGIHVEGWAAGHRDGYLARLADNIAATEMALR